MRWLGSRCGTGLPEGENVRAGLIKRIACGCRDSKYFNLEFKVSVPEAGSDKLAFSGFQCSPGILTTVSP